MASTTVTITPGHHGGRPVDGTVGPVTLHVGCGPTKLEGSIGVDINSVSAADVIHDLDCFPYPFPAESFERIVCDHVLEHLADIPRVMEELHRICTPEGRIEIRVPHFSSVHNFRDPTHRHSFGLRSFDYFIEGTELSRFGYSSRRFRLVHLELPPPAGAGIGKQLLYKLLNRYGDFYENRLAFILPRHLLYFQLTPVK